MHLIIFVCICIFPSHLCQYFSRVNATNVKSVHNGSESNIFFTVTVSNSVSFTLACGMESAARIYPEHQVKYENAVMLKKKE